MFGFGKNVDEIMPTQVSGKLSSGENVFILDVREPHEFEQLRMANSTLIPLSRLGAKDPQLAAECQRLSSAKDAEVVVVCRSGARSLTGASILKQMGFENVKSMRSGVVGWSMAGLPTEGHAAQAGPSGMSFSLF